MKLSGQTVLVTGGGSGIGLALAQSFLQNGSQVIVCGRNVSRLEEAQKNNPGLHIAECDVTNDEQVQALLKKCNDEFDGINILINNAGIAHFDNMLEASRTLEDKFLEIDINLNGSIRMAHYFLPGMLKKSEAAIINISSGLAFVPLAAQPIYSATKAAIHAWTLSMRIQLADHSLKVFELMPPAVDTPMVKDLTSFPKMPLNELAAAFTKAFSKNKLEITPGQSKQLKVMRRMAPNFILKMLNQQTKALLDSQK